MDNDGDDFSWGVRKQGLNFDPNVKYANHPELFIHRESSPWW
ncbi:hypothetical protein HanIR_Chr17g0871921 [Helianthus annuus]|nr:hypothetical protein HanIR_Chr17g0871921 [Helianthus annuus]